MPLFGAHMSIAGGCHNALLEARRTAVIPSSFSPALPASGADAN